MSHHVVVLGAGAMGSLFGGLLAEGGLDVTLVDPWKEHIDLIRQDGLKWSVSEAIARFQSTPSNPPATRAPEARTRL